MAALVGWFRAFPSRTGPWWNDSAPMMVWVLPCESGSLPNTLSAMRRLFGVLLPEEMSGMAGTASVRRPVRLRNGETWDVFRMTRLSSQDAVYCCSQQGKTMKKYCCSYAVLLHLLLAAVNINAASQQELDAAIGPAKSERPLRNTVRKRCVQSLWTIWPSCVLPAGRCPRCWRSWRIGFLSVLPRQKA